MKVLVVRTGALGDSILTFPLLTSIASTHHDAELTLLLNRSYIDLVPQQVRSLPVDGYCQTWLFEETGEEDSPGVHEFDAAYVILNRPDRVVRNLLKAGTELVRHVSSNPNPGSHFVEHVHIGLGFQVPARKLSLGHLATSKKKEVLWFHPGGGSPAKCIPLTLFADLADRLRQDTGWDVVVTSSEQDGFLMGHPGWKRLIAQPNVHLLHNRPLTFLCEELSDSQLYLGNDSGMSHLAAGLGIRSVIFYLTTDPTNWAPWVPENRVLLEDCRGGIPDLKALVHRAHRLRDRR